MFQLSSVHGSLDVITVCDQRSEVSSSDSESEALVTLGENGSFRKLGVPYCGVLMTRILPFRVLY